MLTIPLELEAISMENLLKALLSDSRIFVLVKDEFSNVLFANEAFLSMYAPEVRDTVVGKKSTGHLTSDAVRVFHAEDAKAFETGFSEMVEEMHDYRGVPRVIHSRKVRFYDEAGNMRLLGVLIDVTELSQREKALARSNLMLENFAAIAAHDLRSPLGAVRTSIEAIKADGDTVLSERAQKYFSLMEMSVHGLIDQVSELLKQFKDKQHDKQKNNLCDVSLLLEEVRFNLSTLIEYKRARLMSEAMPKLHANKPMFRQLLHNLIENALKYYRKEGPATVIVRYKNVNDMHQFAVEDNGDGMPCEIADTLFDLGVHQVNGTDPKMGHGIGLALCRDVVTTHGGRIWVDTKYKDGCRICFEFPGTQALSNTDL